MLLNDAEALEASNIRFRRDADMCSSFEKSKDPGAIDDTIRAAAIAFVVSFGVR